MREFADPFDRGRVYQRCDTRTRDDLDELALRGRRFQKCKALFDDIAGREPERIYPSGPR